MTENRTAWKSNNQGDKEDTFIQTGRRGRDRQPGGEDSQQGGTAGRLREMADRGVGQTRL